jgi:23S rRNA pseudouridine1911/1915/1917 synthase
MFRLRQIRSAQRRMSNAPKPIVASGDYVVDDDHEPCSLDRTVRGLQSGLSWNVARRAITSGKVSVNGKLRTSLTHEVRAGDRIKVRVNAPNPQRPPRLPDDVIVHIDSQLLVVRKPSGWLTEPNDDHPYGTLVQALNAMLRKRRPGTPPLWVVQRLDQETTGLVVLARTNEARDHLKEQFTLRTVTRSYLAIAHGQVEDKSFRSRLGDGAKRHRSTRQEHEGKEAVTHVSVVEPFANATLVACRLETGRTHQIRVHLSEAGHPLVGDRRYGYAGTIRAPRLMLHAAELGFVHPVSEQPLHYKEELPQDMNRILSYCRTRPKDS